MIKPKNEKNKRIGVVVSWVSPVSINFVINLRLCIEPFADRLLFVMGTSDVAEVKKQFDSKSYVIQHVSGKNAISRILRYILLELRISSKILNEKQNINTWIFFKGSEGLFFPVLLAKVLGKKIVVMIVGSLEVEGEMKGDVFFKPIIWFKIINCIMANNIIVYSKNLIHYWHMERYSHKILVAHRHFLDFDNFKVTTPFSDRPLQIGYLGRMSEEKGILNLIQALPIIINNHQDLSVFIGGDGPLKEGIELSLQDKKLSDRVHLSGWIPHEDLPNYLNQLRLLILPSYTEGLPNIMLESMACGSPVLATSVGAVPDVIIDGETGFILGNNSSKSIAENVNRALNHPELERIADRGRYFIEENFTFEKTVVIWSKILDDL